MRVTPVFQPAGGKLVGGKAGVTVAPTLRSADWVGFKSPELRPLLIAPVDYTWLGVRSPRMNMCCVDGKKGNRQLTALAQSVIVGFVNQRPNVVLNSDTITMKNKTLSTFAAIGAALTLTAQADLFDNFDSYADQTALLAAWNATAATGT